MKPSLETQKLIDKASHEFFNATQKYISLSDLYRNAQMDAREALGIEFGVKSSSDP